MEMPSTPETEQTRRGLSPAWLAAGAIAVIVLALLSYGLLTGPAEPPQAGNPVPDFQLTALDGSPMNLNEQRSKISVVIFFASWCAPCREEAVDLEQTWREYQDQGVQFFGIAYKDADSKARAFLEEFDVTYPATVERGNRTARAYGVTGVPETFIVDQQGLLVRHILGPITRAELSQELDRLLNR